MGSARRLERVNHLLQEELASLLRSELKDPRVASVTITGVRATSDLAHATVYVRTLGDLDPVEEAIRGLESAEGFIRRRLGRELRLRRIPELRFEADRTLEHARRIESLLEKTSETGRGDGEIPA